MSNLLVLGHKLCRYLKDKVVHLLITAVIFLLGWMLIFIGCNSDRTVITSSILFSIGASLIASAIVFGLDIWREFAREGFLSRTVSVFVDAGLHDIYRKRDLDKYDGQMKDARHVVDIAGYTLNAWYESYADLVVNKARENADFRVRVLMVGCDSAFSTHRATQEGMSQASTRDSFNRIKNKFAGCSNIEIRTIDACLTTMVFRIDDVMYVGPHLYKRPSKGTLTMELERSGWLFQEYEEEFSKLWEFGKPVLDGERTNQDECEPDDGKS